VWGSNLSCFPIWCKNNYSTTYDLFWSTQSYFPRMWNNYWCAYSSFKQYMCVCVCVCVWCWNIHGQKSSNVLIIMKFYLFRRLFILLFTCANPLSWWQSHEN
jgi:hypothetical protein